MVISETSASSEFFLLLRRWIGIFEIAKQPTPQNEYLVRLKLNDITIKQETAKQVFVKHEGVADTNRRPGMSVAERYQLRNLTACYQIGKKSEENIKIWYFLELWIPQSYQNNSLFRFFPAVKETKTASLGQWKIPNKLESTPLHHLHMIPDLFSYSIVQTMCVLVLLHHACIAQSVVLIQFRLTRTVWPELWT